METPTAHAVGHTGSTVPSPASRPGTTGLVLCVSGIASAVLMFVLLLETMEVYKDPGHVTSCPVNSVFACGRVIDSWQAAVFGFPNAMVGLVIFTATVAAGLYLLAGAGGAGSRPWPHVLVWVLLSAMLGMSSWMMLQQFFVIGGLCTYCTGAWLLTFPAWWYLSLYLLNRGDSASAVARTLAGWHLVPMVLWYLLWAGLFVWAFSDVLL